MNEETARAGANPAEPVPDGVQTAVDAAIAAATAHLRDTLSRASRFLDACESLTEGPSSMALPALAAAARILRNQADAAERLARVARGETRHRTIVEVINRATGELNSKNSTPLAHLSDDEIRERIMERLNFQEDPEGKMPTREESCEKSGHLTPSDGSSPARKMQGREE